MWFHILVFGIFQSSASDDWLNRFITPRVPACVDLISEDEVTRIRGLIESSRADVHVVIARINELRDRAQGLTIKNILEQVGLAPGDLEVISNELNGHYHSAADFFKTLSRAAQTIYREQVNSGKNGVDAISMLNSTSPHEELEINVMEGSRAHLNIDFEPGLSLTVVTQFEAKEKTWKFEFQLTGQAPTGSVPLEVWLINKGVHNGKYAPGVNIGPIDVYLPPHPNTYFEIKQTVGRAVTRRIKLRVKGWNTDRGKTIDSSVSYWRPDVSRPE